MSRLWPELKIEPRAVLPVPGQQRVHQFGEGARRVIVLHPAAAAVRRVVRDRGAAQAREAEAGGVDAAPVPVRVVPRNREIDREVVLKRRAADRPEVPVEQPAAVAGRGVAADRDVGELRGAKVPHAAAVAALGAVVVHGRVAQGNGAQIGDPTAVAGGIIVAHQAVPPGRTGEALVEVGAGGQAHARIVEDAAAIAGQRLVPHQRHAGADGRAEIGEPPAAGARRVLADRHVAQEHSAVVVKTAADAVGDVAAEDHVGQRQGPAEAVVDAAAARPGVPGDHHVGQLQDAVVLDAAARVRRGIPANRAVAQRQGVVVHDPPGPAGRQRDALRRQGRRRGQGGDRGRQDRDHRHRRAEKPEYSENVPHRGLLPFCHSGALDVRDDRSGHHRRLGSTTCQGTRADAWIAFGAKPCRENRGDARGSAISRSSTSGAVRAREMPRD